MPHVAGVEHGYAEVRGARLHYAEAGEGPPVLLVHGWPQHWWMWRHHIAPLAANGRRVIAADLRGYGWSDKTARGYRKEELMADMLGLLDALGIDRAGWIGHDWGAVTGLLAALDHPDRIERFAALSVPHPWRRGAPPPKLIANSAYQFVLAAPVVGKLSSSRFGAERRALQAARVVGRYSAEELDTFEAPFRQPGGAQVTMQTYRSFLTPGRPRRCLPAGRRRLTVPALWMVGTRDPVARFADDGIYEHADEVELVRVEGAGHFLPEEEPDLVRERLLEFVS